MTGPRGVGPGERMLTVLARLRDRPTRIWPAEDLRRDIGGYENSIAGDRNWQFDSRTLRDRGLIETSITSPHTPRRTGVRYALPIKPGNLYLSEGEHAALMAARRIRGAGEIPSPLAGDAVRGKYIAPIAEALRRLEESGDWMRVGDLAGDMGLDPAWLWDRLKRAWCLEVSPGSGSLRIFDVEDCDGDQERRPSEVQVCVFRGDDPQHPLRDAGLALLGVGAYTKEETAERLELIEDVLAGNLPGDVEVFGSAKAKLLKWQEILNKALS
jgi:hypothetical protein